MPERDPWGERLPRTVGLWPAIVVLIGITIGSGIFRVPATVASRLGSPGLVLVAWVSGGVLALFGFAAPTGSVRNFTPLWTGSLGLSAVAAAMVSVMWAYDGWADLSFMSGEVKDPSRTLPRALILGTLAIILIYLLVNLAYMYLVPLPEMAQSRLIASTAAERIPILGLRGAGLISGVVLI